MTESQKYRTIIIIILVFFGILVSILLVRKYINKLEDQKQIYLTINGETSFSYQNQRWIAFRENKADDYSWRKYKVYQNQAMTGSYFGQYFRGWYFYDLNRNPVTITPPYLAIDSNTDTKVLLPSVVSLSKQDQNEIETVLLENHLPKDTSLTLQEKANVTLNGEKGTIYSISNYSISSKQDIVFSFVYLKRENEREYIVKKIEKDNDQKLIGTYRFSYLLDLFDNQKYAMIITYSDNEKNCHSLYIENKNRFQKKIGC